MYIYVLYKLVYVYIYIKNPSVVNTICIDSFRYNMITCARLQMCRPTKANTEMKRQHCTKRWNWSSCTKLALRAS